MRVWHYDGRSALRREADIAIGGEGERDGFTIVEADRTTGPFAFADLIANDAATGDPSFGLKRTPGWRIAFPDGVPKEIAAHLPARARYGGVIDRIGLWPAAGLFTLAAAGAIAIVLSSPALLARAVPASVERKLGEAMVGDFGRNGCEAPAGAAALAALLRRVDPADPTLEVHVVKLPMVNAVTLPGGRIVIFDGLIQAARSPDEVAGVIGHEIGHVRGRDVMESLLRQMGLSVLLGGLDGQVGGYTNALLAATYSRAAEARADGFAITLMQEAKISPVATAGFFTRLGGKSASAERMFAYLASHPVSIDRAKRFTQGSVKGARYTPAIDAAQWRALRSICDGKTEDRRWRF